MQRKNEFARYCGIVQIELFCWKIGKNRSPHHYKQIRYYRQLNGIQPLRCKYQIFNCKCETWWIYCGFYAFSAQENFWRKLKFQNPWFPLMYCKSQFGYPCWEFVRFEPITHFEFGRKSVALLGVGRRIDDGSWFHFGALPKSQFLLYTFPKTILVFSTKSSH